MYLYFWFRGVDKDRIGGPWWVRTGPRETLEGFVRDARPFLHAWCIANTPPSDPYYIEPPEPWALIHYETEGKKQ
jgi:hypothetical protein